MRVAILGCGYVGCALARRLEGNHDVVGVRRSNLDAVRAAGAEPVAADVTDPDGLSAVPDVDALVFAASSDSRDAAAARRTYVDGLRAVLDEFATRPDPPDRLVYTSSTGVYGDHGGAWVDEETPPDPDTERGRALVDAEAVVADAAERGVHGTVARLAGLYGPGRYRIDRYLEGPIRPGYLNLIHREDAAGALAHLLTEPTDDVVVLVVDDEPVDRPVLADWLAERCGVPRPDRVGDRREHGGSRMRRGDKRCSNDRLRGLGYELAYPTFREGYSEAVPAQC